VTSSVLAWQRCGVLGVIVPALQVSFTLLVTCFIIVGILNFDLSFLYICYNFFNKTNGES
jgi:hypothetical protein